MEEHTGSDFVMTTTDGAGLSIVRFLGIVNAKDDYAEDERFPQQMVRVQRQLHEQALALGANAIIGLRIESNGYSGACFGYGTAVVYDPRPAAADEVEAPKPAPRKRPATPKAEQVPAPDEPAKTQVPMGADKRSGYVFPFVT